MCIAACRGSSAEPSGQACTQQCLWIWWLQRELSGVFLGLKAAVTGMDVISAYGWGVEALREGFAAERTALTALEEGPVGWGGVCPDPNLRELLTRRRDLKIFSRSARLLLRAAADSAQGWKGNPEEMGLFFWDSKGALGYRRRRRRIGGLSGGGSFE